MAFNITSSKKEFTYRGKTMEDMLKLDIREFAKLLKSRARRSVLRHFDIIERFVQESRKKQENGKQIKTHLRQMIVVPPMVGMKIAIHNGKEFVNIQVEKEMLGHRFGEFVATRQKVEHGAPGIGATKSSGAMSVK